MNPVWIALIVTVGVVVLAALVRLTGCRHRWETIDPTVVRDPFGDVCRLYVLRCEHCGAIRSKSVKP